MATAISTITPGQLHAAQLRGDRPALLDARTAAEFRAGHIPGVQLLPIGELGPEEVTRRYKHAAPGHQEPLYITCRSGMAQLIVRMPWNRGEHCPDRMNA